MACENPTSSGTPDGKVAISRPSRSLPKTLRPEGLHDRDVGLQARGDAALRLGVRGADEQHAVHDRE